MLKIKVNNQKSEVQVSEDSFLIELSTAYYALASLLAKYNNTDLERAVDSLHTIALINYQSFSKHGSKPEIISNDRKEDE